MLIELRPDTFSKRLKFDYHNYAKSIPESTKGWMSSLAPKTGPARQADRLHIVAIYVPTALLEPAVAILASPGGFEPPLPP